MKYKIAIIEDDALSLESYKYMLKKKHYDLLTFNKGYTALDKIKQTPPDLIILDLALPDIDGIEVCKVLKSNKTLSSIPIIMVTGRYFDNERGLKSGADAYIVKPVIAEDLLSKIEFFINNK